MATSYTDLYNFVTNTGVIVPNTDDVKTSIQDKFRDIFGADLDVTDETPVGRLIEAITVLVKTTLGVTAQNANQFNVNTATGIYLDSLAQVYGISREVGTYTRAKIHVTASAAGCTIPAGALIQNKNTFDMFKVENAITIAANQQTGSGYAVAVETGPVAAESDQLTIIKTGTLGWLSVTNEDATTVGRLEETDEEFRARILSSRPIGTSFLTNVYSRIARVDGVSSCLVYENNNAGDIYKNGIVIPGHSIYVCVLGGTDSDIAEAIVDTKPPGTGFATDEITGAELVEVSYSSSGYSSNIYFYRPSTMAIDVNVLVDTSFYTGTDIQSDVTNAIKEYMTTTGIGETIYSTKLSLAITSAIPTISVASITIGSHDPSESADDISYGVKVALTGYQIGRVVSSGTGVTAPSTITVRTSDDEE